MVMQSLIHWLLNPEKEPLPVDMVPRANYTVNNIAPIERFMGDVYSVL